MTHYFIYALVPLVLIVLLKLASMEKPVEMDDNSFLLRYGKTLRAFGIGLPSFFILFIGIMGFENMPQNHDDIKSYFWLLGMSLLLLLYFYLEFFHVKIIVSNENIIATTPWKGTRKFSWKEIEKVSYSQKFQWLKLKTYNKKTLYISLYISGFDEFKRKMMDKLQIPKYQEALEKMNE
jgi:hypothetical protein